MEIEEKQKIFLEEVTKIKPFKMLYPVDMLIEEVPRFLADFLGMLYRGNSFNSDLKDLIEHYGCGEKPFWTSKTLVTLTLDPSEVEEKKIRSHAEKIYDKHFSDGKKQKYLLDICHRLDASKSCLIFEECPGIKRGNSGVGGCEGLVYCPVFKFNGHHNFKGISQEGRLEEMRRLIKIYGRKQK